MHYLFINASKNKTKVIYVVDDIIISCTRNGRTKSRKLQHNSILEATFWKHFCITTPVVIPLNATSMLLFSETRWP